jgi:hypothetical protein
MARPTRLAANAGLVTAPVATREAPAAVHSTYAACLSYSSWRCHHGPFSSWWPAWSPRLLYGR